MTKIFISGPMFSPADLWEGNQIKSTLEADGFETYFAPSDGIEDERLIKGMNSPRLAVPEYRQISLLVQKLGWTLDIYMATFGCDGMVMNMNGRVPDGGSLVEAANAYACGMPLVLYKDTSITMWGPFDNPMVAALTKDWEPVGSYEALPPALREAIADRDPDYVFSPNPTFSAYLTVGKWVAENRDGIMNQLLEADANIDDLHPDLEHGWEWLLMFLGFPGPVAGP